MHQLLASSSFQDCLRRLPMKHGVISFFYKREDQQPSELDDAIEKIEAVASMPVEHANVFCIGNALVLTLGFSIPECNADLMIYHDSRKAVTTYQIVHREQVHIYIPSMTRLLLINEDPANLLDLHFDSGSFHAEKIIKAFGLRVSGVILDKLEYQANVLELERI